MPNLITNLVDMVPVSDDLLDIGHIDLRFKNLCLSGVLSDGTNSISVADIVSAGGGTWGAISGTLSNQTDLQIILDAKQPLDTNLTSISALGTAADKMLYTTAADTWEEASLTAAGRSILDDADVGAIRTTLGVGTGDSPTFDHLHLSTNLYVDHIGETTTSHGVQFDNTIGVNAAAVANYGAYIVGTNSSAATATVGVLGNAQNSYAGAQTGSILGGQFFGDQTVAQTVNASYGTQSVVRVTIDDGTITSAVGVEGRAVVAASAAGHPRTITTFYAHSITSSVGANSVLANIIGYYMPSTVTGSTSTLGVDIETVCNNVMKGWLNLGTNTTATTAGYLGASRVLLNATAYLDGATAGLLDITGAVQQTGNYYRYGKQAYISGGNYSTGDWINICDNAYLDTSHVWHQGADATAGSMLLQLSGSGIQFFTGTAADPPAWTSRFKITSTAATSSVPFARGTNAITGAGDIGATGTYVGIAYITRHYFNPTADINGATAGVLAGTGSLTLSGAIGMTAAQKIYLDGVAMTGDTYITESSANVMDLALGGNILRLSRPSAGVITMTIV